MLQLILHRLSRLVLHRFTSCVSFSCLDRFMFILHWLIRLILRRFTRDVCVLRVVFYLSEIFSVFSGLYFFFFFDLYSGRFLFHLTRE